MNRITLAAYAKINLSLGIVGRRPDGYHRLDSIMQSVSLADRMTLEITSARTIQLFISDPALPSDQRNTAYRAARFFFEQTGIPCPGLSIQIEKAIPSGAGLGGGSADAAAVIRGLQRLYMSPLSPEQQTAVAVSVGADVPFCLTGGTCRAEGIGERLTRLPPLPACSIVLAKPRRSISTPMAYGAYDRLPAPAPPDTTRLIQALDAADVRLFARLLDNVLEQAVPLPDIRRLQSIMTAAGALASRMTGSGSAVFGLFLEQERAEDCLQTLRQDSERIPFSVLCQPVGAGIQILSGG